MQLFIQNTEANMYENDQKYAYILGVRIDITSETRVLRQVRYFINHKKKFYIVTPNPEQVIRAQADRQFKKIINTSDISLPDGVGLLAAQRFLRLPSKNTGFSRGPVLLAQGLRAGLSLLSTKKRSDDEIKIVKGREMFLSLIKLSNQKGWKVYLLGGEHDEAAGTKKNLEKIYKKVAIRSFSGPLLNEDGYPATDKDKILEERAVKEISSFQPDLLFLAFVYPKQEKWMYRWLTQLPVGGAMVLGGTFNFVSGRSKLPPKIFEKMGFEWLWRLMTEPKRFKRIFRAFPLFPYKVFLYKLRN